jgi:hypothetical protein
VEVIQGHTCNEVDLEFWCSHGTKLTLIQRGEVSYEVKWEGFDEVTSEPDTYLFVVPGLIRSTLIIF